MIVLILWIQRIRPVDPYDRIARLDHMDLVAYRAPPSNHRRGGRRGGGDRTGGHVDFGKGVHRADRASADGSTFFGATHGKTAGFVDGSTAVREAAEVRVSAALLAAFADVRKGEGSGGGGGAMVVVVVLMCGGMNRLRFNFFL